MTRTAAYASVSDVRMEQPQLFYGSWREVDKQFDVLMETLQRVPRDRVPQRVRVNDWEYWLGA